MKTLTSVSRPEPTLEGRTLLGLMLIIGIVSILCAFLMPDIAKSQSWLDVRPLVLSSNVLAAGNTVALGGSSSNVGPNAPMIELGRARDITFYARFITTNAGVSNVTWYFKGTGDGTNVTTAYPYSVIACTFAGAGTQDVSFRLTNVTDNGIQLYLQQNAQTGLVFVSRSFYVLKDGK